MMEFLDTEYKITIYKIFIQVKNKIEKYEQRTSISKENLKKRNNFWTQKT